VGADVVALGEYFSNIVKTVRAGQSAANKSIYGKD
jgi:hypothetical protein